MFRLISWLMIAAIFLTGCSDNGSVEPALALREQLLASDGCAFCISISADYGDSVYSFVMDCTTDANGNITFSVIEPEPISGITGKIDQDGGKLIFDEKILTFPLLADEQLTPVSAPWLLIRGVRSGYIGAVGKDGDNYKVQLDDSFEEDPLKMDLWINEESIPIHCDFLWDNRRIITVSIENFRFL